MLFGVGSGGSLVLGGCLGSWKLFECLVLSDYLGVWLMVVVSVFGSWWLFRCLVVGGLCRGSWFLVCLCVC